MTIVFPKYKVWKQYLLKIMPQEPFYVLYALIVQNIGGVATTPVPVDFKDLPYPG